MSLMHYSKLAIAFLAGATITTIGNVGARAWQDNPEHFKVTDDRVQNVPAPRGPRRPLSNTYVGWADQEHDPSPEENLALYNNAFYLIPQTPIMTIKKTDIAEYCVAYTPSGTFENQDSKGETTDKAKYAAALSLGFHLTPDAYDRLLAATKATIGPDGLGPYVDLKTPQGETYGRVRFSTEGLKRLPKDAASAYKWTIELTFYRLFINDGIDLITRTAENQALRPCFEQGNYANIRKLFEDYGRSDDIILFSNKDEIMTP